LAAIYRAEWGRLLSMLVARTRRLDLAEDALGEAFARASARWQIAGVPANLGGWLSSCCVAIQRCDPRLGRRLPLGW
jgi:predicted RNA polymerase sigma factor